ncbi:DNA-binding transcriptional LysR family regulator [Herbihabitans rhizosphaerae]|uniref:DNA-binding transcriptional LysR family regulator n=1 Tax=Herbihabitans rhizosphaerae TaxID=1872711 RepID=A0A4Q7L5F5_9PSEU|nr:LysR family transcriptional regulator [Herbihabitans rhizosphaerae]RZS43482.1 DNA-binding transcriptional LysR family regulator [Herbihabitans rhizosphaerae]
MLELRRLRLLTEFVRRGSIAATASSLGYTPSAVSQQLAALEREVGVALLDRTARSAELTDAGRRLAERSEEILTLVEAAEADLSAQENAPTGRVVVTGFPTAAVAFAPALARSLGDHPGLTFVLRQTRPGEGLRQVQSGEVDIALIDDWTGKAPEQAPSTLKFFHLRRDPVVLALPEGHAMADPTVPVDLQELRDQPWMAAPAGEPSRRAVERLLDTVGGARPVPWEFEGLHTILSLVARGIGITAVPALTLAAGDQGVAVRRLPGRTIAREVYAVTRTASVRRPSVAVTLGAIHAAARQTQPTPPES